MALQSFFWPAKSGRGGLNGAVAIVAVLFPSLQCKAETLACERIPVTVLSSDSGLAEWTCGVAAGVMPSLSQCGVEVTAPVAISVVEELPSHCMGRYHCEENLIEVLSPEAIERERSVDGPFRTLPTEVYFASIVAHELAHAAYNKVLCPYPNCLATSEYVAYAMQIHSLPEEDRRALDAAPSAQEHVGRDHFSAVGLMMAPDRFAQDVWAHFLQRDDGCAYVARLMAGEFFLDSERP